MIIVENLSLHYEDRRTGIDENLRHVSEFHFTFRYLESIKDSIPP